MSSRLGASPATAPSSGPAVKPAATSAKASQGEISAAAPGLTRVSTSKARPAGATSERRRLSNIFQRLMARSG